MEELSTHLISTSKRDPRQYPVGSEIIKRYKVIKRLGTGASGSVYKCKDTMLGSLEVAIKVFPQWVREDPVAAKRIERELKILSRLRHDHIVQFYSAISNESLTGYVMELAHGETLASYINRNTSIPFDEIVFIAKQILSGLDCIHSRGLMHRDLKPANIVIGYDGIIKIVDFGLAVVSDESDSSSSLSTFCKSSLQAGDVTHRGKFIGTPAYAAPEQLEGAVISSAADLYALGTILYEMITGILPFNYASSEDLFRKKLLYDPVDIRTIREDCPNDLADLVMRLLSRDPINRNQDTRYYLKELSLISTDAKVPKVQEPYDHKILRIYQEKTNQIKDIFKVISKLLSNGNPLFQIDNTSFIKVFFTLCVAATLTFFVNRYLSYPDVNYGQNSLDNNVENPTAKSSSRIISPSIKKSKSRVIRARE